jgi:hypothetical protein
MACAHRCRFQNELWIKFALGHRSRDSDLRSVGFGQPAANVSRIELRMGWESQSSCKISETPNCATILPRLEHALSGRLGQWRVSIAGSRAAENWVLRVERTEWIGTVLYSLVRPCHEIADTVRQYLGISPTARQHLANSRVEFLKALRVMLDARIEHLSSQPQKGAKVAVE